MDQNIIILILILIAILVSFYATYVSIDNAKKIRKLQNDIRDTLGNINSSLHLNNSSLEKNTEPVVKRNSELDQFPSLSEIENYDKELKPLDESLKKELDSILEDGEKPTENVEDKSDSGDVKESGDVEEVNEQQLEDVEELEKVEELEQPETADVEIIHEELNIEEELENLMNQNQEEKLDINLEENILSVENVSKIESVENRVEDGAVDDTDTESKSGNATDSLPELSSLTEEMVRGMSDKNLKVICKRDGLKVRGTKPERIARIMDAINYKININ